MNIILTIYYNKFIDPQRNKYKNANDFNYIKKLYDSVIKHKMNTIIFFDNLNDDFINTYSNEYVKFIKIDYFLNKYNYKMTSMNDIRFLIYRDYLSENKIYDKVLITDVSDEEFYTNVFNKINCNHFIYVNPDRNRNYEHYYIKDRIDKTYNYNKFESFKNNNIVQASMISGYYDIILKFLNHVKHEFDHEIKSVEYNCNYIVVNYVIYKYFNNIVFGKKGSDIKTKCGKEILFLEW